MHWPWPERAAVPFVAPSSDLPHAGPSLLALACDFDLRRLQDLP
jgi:hypothetical protein